MNQRNWLNLPHEAGEGVDALIRVHSAFLVLSEVACCCCPSIRRRVFRFVDSCGKDGLQLTNNCPSEMSLSRILSFLPS